MLFDFWQPCLGSCCLGTVVIWAMTAFAQMYNQRLPKDQEEEETEEKKDYHPYAWVAVPFLLPLWLAGAIFSAIGLAVLLGLLLVFFTLGLLFARKPFLFKWMKEIALKVGRPILKINTWLLRRILPISPV